MSTIYSPSIVKEGLILFLDAANPRSYPGSGTTLTNIGLDTTITTASLFGNVSYGNVSNGVINISGEGDNSVNGTFLRGEGNIAYSVNSDFTSIGWLYRTNERDGEVLSYREDSWRCSFVIDDTVMSFIQRETVNTAVINTTSVSVTNGLNEWDCFALTKSGTSFNFYKNGESVGSTTMTITETISGTRYHVGAAWSDDDYRSNGMNGSIGPVMHYERLLSPDEIRKNYEAYKGRFRS